MHPYYKKKKNCLRRNMYHMLKYIKPEIEKYTRISYDEIFDEVWSYYLVVLLPFFPYLGGDKNSETKNFTEAYSLVAMGEVLRKYSVNSEQRGELITRCHEKMYKTLPFQQEKTLRRIFVYPNRDDENHVCPIDDFAKERGYSTYMRYLCNLNYVVFGAFGIPVYRTHTCLIGANYCESDLRERYYA